MTSPALGQTAAPARSVIQRNNVAVSGDPAGRPIVFAHGFGCSQEVWRNVVPAFAEDHLIVLFDHVGAGGSDLSAYDPGKYDSLHGYADDLNEILDELNLHDVVYVGHSVSSMVGVLAANRDPSRFGALVLVAPSPRYVNDGDYVGGFEQEDIDSLLDTLDSNYLGWSSAVAPMMTGNHDRPEIGQQLTDNFCSTDPTIARHFARVTFLSDNRRDLASVTVPTLVLQSTDDVIAPLEVGSYVADAIPGSRLVVMATTGHCPNLSDPVGLAAEIRAYLG
ncbi:alpha/beta fold hydrolase [Lacisediminihabitans changchengi]|uniref:Alpha/beta hydrolase n=1 Tax=Lacisediminihabitans changchengi TaxID=2787634 RepID=A0A934SMJ2_9MICO|nr:alpha/beta hydrolase [Lacisediminihabitans changchengi]MBK4348268.1 alpha/beta hydrolase [Lacisediminihabitans changchengi]